MARFEKYYGKAFKSVLWVVNPFKKKIIKTECQVHRFINYQAIKILAKNGYKEEYDIFNLYLEFLNAGTVWADQDFKSINHFYSPVKKRGLYGHNNALALAEKYYKNAINHWKLNDREKSMFYLGASVHIIQDLTIPQHVNIRLLDSHRQFENFIKLIYDIVKDFRSYKEPIIFNTPKEFVQYNSKVALKTYKKYKHIEKNKRRFYKIALCALPLAQRTTAGYMIMFLRDAS